MRKIFAVILTATILMSLVAGCGERTPSEPTTEATTEPARSGITHKDLFNSLKSRLAPLTGQFSMTSPDKMQLEDRTNWSVHIIDSITDSKYRISVSCTMTGEVSTITMHALRGSGTELNFALISYYLYKSIGLSEMEAEEFYDHFDMLTNSPSGELTVNGWWIHASTSDGLLTFIACFE